jgi:hypothetical protein
MKKRKKTTSKKSRDTVPLKEKQLKLKKKTIAILSTPPLY